jgi:hypothetical protein
MFRGRPLNETVLKRQRHGIKIEVVKPSRVVLEKQQVPEFECSAQEPRKYLFIQRFQTQDMKVEQLAGGLEEPHFRITKR